MRPLFTIHAGELVVANYIEKHHRSLQLWVPAKDTGIDLLVTNASNTRTVSLQVKMSHDYLAPKASSEFGRMQEAGGWLSLAHDKVAKSKADYWVIAIVSGDRSKDPQFIVIPPAKLLESLVATHGKAKRYQLYPWVMKHGTSKESPLALNGRGLLKEDRELLADGKLPPELLKPRDWTPYLNNWTWLERLAQRT